MRKSNPFIFLYSSQSMKNSTNNVGNFLFLFGLFSLLVVAIFWLFFSLPLNKAFWLLIILIAFLSFQYWINNKKPKLLNLPNKSKREMGLLLQENLTYYIALLSLGLGLFASGMGLLRIDELLSISFIIFGLFLLLLGDCVYKFSYCPIRSFYLKKR